MMREVKSMDERNNQTSDQGSAPIEPMIAPDVATEPHPSAHVPPLPEQPVTTGNNGRLQEVLPEVLEAARKVGGFKKLAELAAQLDRDGM
jgi:hypothetical protein